MFFLPPEKPDLRKLGATLASRLIAHCVENQSNR